MIKIKAFIVLIALLVSGVVVHGAMSQTSAPLQFRTL